MSGPSPLLTELKTRSVETVVIGASAGAVEALNVILPVLPHDFPAAILIVLHVPADRPSHLAELYGPRCALPVQEAEDKEPILPGTITFAPPGYHLLIETDRTMSLSVEEPIHFSRPSIDPLFESAAWAYRQRLLGIILTGASEDGSQGLLTLCQRGGIAWVQAPHTATVPLMPQAAIAACPKNHTLTLDEMAEVLKSWRED